jgi:malonyl-CoA decarboxylase
MPGFRKWLDEALAENREALSDQEAVKLAVAVGTPDPARALNDALARPGWMSDPRVAEALRAPMERFCARYLLREKSGGHPLDSVAQFHLHNGALIDRIYWLADTSPRGLKQSYGMMVSYRYDLSEVDKNHERFQNNGTIVATGRVQGLLD